MPKQVKAQYIDSPESQVTCFGLVYRRCRKRDCMKRDSRVSLHCLGSAGKRVSVGVICISVVPVGKPVKALLTGSIKVGSAHPESR